MSGVLPTYAIVTAVRDEERFFRTTGLSVIAQTHRPQQWVIVDDGSKDRTRSIAESFAATHDWITVIDSGVDHARARGAPIVAAFNAGRNALAQRSDLIVKMDGDLFLPANYFEWVAATFAHDPRAGIVGGVVLIHDGGCWRVDAGSHHHVNGVAKTYRADCLEEIGGLRPSMGWDGIDEYGAKSRGWRVHVLRELSILHYERRGAKQPWHRARFEEGRGAHFMGYLPTFLLVRALYRMLVEQPSGTRRSRVPRRLLLRSPHGREPDRRRLGAGIAQGGAAGAAGPACAREDPAGGRAPSWRRAGLLGHAAGPRRSPCRGPPAGRLVDRREDRRHPAVLFPLRHTGAARGARPGERGPRGRCDLHAAAWAAPLRAVRLGRRVPRAPRAQAGRSPSIPVRVPQLPVCRLPLRGNVGPATAVGRGPGEHPARLARVRGDRPAAAGRARPARPARVHAGVLRHEVPCRPLASSGAHPGPARAGEHPLR